MKPEFSDEHISAYLDGELTAEESRQIEQLLVDNREHRQVFYELRDMRNKLKSLPQEKLPADFSQRVLAMAKTEIAQAKGNGRKTEVTKPVAPSVAPPHPAQTGWIAAVTLAAASAAAVLGLLAFPPVLPELQNPVALAPTSQPNERSETGEDSNGEQLGMGPAKKEDASELQRNRRTAGDELELQQRQKKFKNTKEIEEKSSTTPEENLDLVVRKTERAKKQINKNPGDSETNKASESDRKNLETYSTDNQPGGESSETSPDRDLRYRQSVKSLSAADEAPPTVRDDVKPGEAGVSVAGMANAEASDKLNFQAAQVVNDFSDQLFAQVRLSEMRLAVIEPPTSTRGLNSLSESLGRHAVSLQRVETLADRVAFEAVEGEVKTKERTQAIPSGYDLAVLEGNADDVAKVLSQWKAKPASFAYNRFANGVARELTDTERKDLHKRFGAKDSDKSRLPIMTNNFGKGAAGGSGAKLDAEGGAGGFDGAASQEPAAALPAPAQTRREGFSVPTAGEELNKGEAASEGKPFDNSQPEFAAKPKLETPKAAPLADEQLGDAENDVQQDFDEESKAGGKNEEKQRSERTKRDEAKKIRVLVLIRTQNEAAADQPAEADTEAPPE